MRAAHGSRERRMAQAPNTSLSPCAVDTQEPPPQEERSPWAGQWPLGCRTKCLTSLRTEQLIPSPLTPDGEGARKAPPVSCGLPRPGVQLTGLALTQTSRG
jgi:hypothetical protein